MQIDRKFTIYLEIIEYIHVTKQRRFTYTFIYVLQVMKFQL